MCVGLWLYGRYSWGSSARDPPMPSMRTFSAMPTIVSGRRVARGIQNALLSGINTVNCRPMASPFGQNLAASFRLAIATPGRSAVSARREVAAGDQRDALVAK